MIKENSMLLKGSVTNSLIKFTVPIFISMAIQILYTSVDMLIIGNFGSVADASGVSIASQLMTMLTNLCIGLATGATIYIGHKIGKSEHSVIGSIIANSVSIFIIISFVIMFVMLLFNFAIVDILHTPDQAVKETSDYLFYCSLGIPMIFAYNILGSIFKGIGDSKTSMYAVIIACLINIILDYLFIAHFNMGASGAAIATVIAQAFSVFLSLVIVKKRKDFPYSITKKDFAFNKIHIKEILILGVPVALQSILLNLAFMIVTTIINSFNILEYSVAVGISGRVSALIMLVPLAFMQSLAVFVAQNIGANNISRAKKSLKSTLTISFIFSVVMAYITFFHGDILATFFNKSPGVINETILYLKAYAFDVLVVSIKVCFIGYLNGCGKTFFVMSQSLVGAFLIRAPLALVLSKVLPTSLFTIGLAIPIATFCEMIFCIGYYIYIEKQRKKAIIKTNKQERNLGSFI